MLLVETFIAASLIHGIGLHASHAIAAGRLVWRFKEQIDRKVLPDELEGLPAFCVGEVLHYGYINPEGRIVICGDNARFCNFSGNPNLALGEVHQGEYDLIAAHDIEPGAELTVPPESDEDFERKMRCSR